MILFYGLRSSIAACNKDLTMFFCELRTIFIKTSKNVASRSLENFAFFSSFYTTRIFCNKLGDVSF